MLTILLKSRILGKKNLQEIHNTIEKFEILGNLKLKKANRALWEILEAQCRIALVIGKGEVELD